MLACCNAGPRVARSSSSSTASWIDWSMRSARAMRCSPMQRSRCSPDGSGSLRRSSARWPRRSNANATATSRSTADDLRSKIDAIERQMAHRLSVSPMRVVVAGLGVQGHKRRRIAGADFVAAVDPVNAEARLPRRSWTFRSRTMTRSWPASPTSPRSTCSHYLLGNGKHVLVEKPLWAKHESEIART